MSNISKPNSFSASTPISSSQVNANFDTIYNDYNGGVSEANLADNAVTTDKIADDAVTGAKIADATVTSANLQMQAWQTWTPTWTNLTVGNGVVTAKYIQIGKTVHAYVEIVFGNATSVSGFIRVSLPATAVSRYTSSEQIVSGSTTLYDSGTNTYVGYSRFVSTTALEIGAVNVASTYAVESSTSSTVPFTWTTSDAIVLNISYEAA